MLVVKIAFADQPLGIPPYTQLTVQRIAQYSVIRY
jgi:hypothetical protein